MSQKVIELFETFFPKRRSIALQALAFRGEEPSPHDVRLCGLALPLFPAGVKCLPLHYTLVGIEYQ